MSSDHPAYTEARAYLTATLNAIAAPPPWHAGLVTLMRSDLTDVPVQR